MSRKLSFLLVGVFLLCLVSSMVYCKAEEKVLANNLPVNNSKRINIMPVPKKTIKLVYNDKMVDKGTRNVLLNDKSVVGKSVYIGNDRLMFYSRPDRTFAYDNSKNKQNVYLATTTKFSNSNILTLTEKSSISIYREPSFLFEIPFLGIYQPRYSFFDNYVYIKYTNDKVSNLSTSGVECAKIEYNKNKDISKVSIYFGNYLLAENMFSEYKYYKNIDMTIPSKITFYYYVIENNPTSIKKAHSVFDFSEELNLISADYLDNDSVVNTIFGFQKPSASIGVSDQRPEYNVSYYYDSDTMGTIDKESARQLKLQKNSDKEKNNTNTTVFKVLSFLVIVIMIYLVVVIIRKNKKNNK